MLEKQRVSGIDLSGNYLIQAPELLAISLDRPNLYKESQPIWETYLSQLINDLGDLFPTL